MLHYSYNLFLSTPDQVYVCVCMYKGHWWFILVHLAVFVRPISSLHDMCGGKSFVFGCLCADGRFLFHAATRAQVISMLKYLISFFYLIDYVNDNKRGFFPLQILIRKKLLNDGRGGPPHGGLPWRRTGVPAVICGKAHGIFFLFCNTDLTRIGKTSCNIS